MYITLSETADELRANAASHGWSLDGIHIQELQPAENLRPEEEYTLFHPAEIELGDLSKNVFEAVERCKPARAVLDSVSDMRLLARDSLRYRRQILGPEAVLRRAELHAAPAERERRERSGPAHPEPVPRRDPPRAADLDFGLVRRRLEISKLRGVAYVGGFHDFKIQTGGLLVFPRLENRRQVRALPGSTLKSGIAAVDALLDDGLPMGTCTLILGPSGRRANPRSPAQYLCAAASEKITGRRVSVRRAARDVHQPQRRARA